jgi:hypothetical protein
VTIHDVEPVLVDLSRLHLGYVRAGDDQHAGPYPVCIGECDLGAITAYELPGWAFVAESDVDRLCPAFERRRDHIRTPGERGMRGRAGDQPRHDPGVPTLSASAR